MSEELELPRNIVNRIAKAKLPESFIVAKDAKMALSYAGGVFILYLSATAQDICNERGRSTITPNDIYDALKDIGFDDMTETLKGFLANWKGDSKDKPAAKKGPRKASDEKATEHATSSATAPTNDNTADVSVDALQKVDDDEPPSKAPRVES
eukprot:TRINITY_DN2911_c0_g1_i1.p1 TRINITY_DN2911_c0_g1~~TRINITY_DN2911_c0_g1_i1.p1  ORF type:complete len:153 (+),score=39.33 TRINITY_DN2911_c0_g1_i1:55-513(+)